MEERDHRLSGLCQQTPLVSLSALQSKLASLFVWQTVFEQEKRHQEQKTDSETELCLNQDKVGGLVMKWINTIISIIALIITIYYYYSDDPLAKTLFIAAMSAVVLVNLAW